MRLSYYDQIDPKTKHESLAGLTTEFPYRASVYEPNEYPDGLYPWHWHRELEIFYIREGALVYHLPGENVEFRAGMAGFLNTNVLHESLCVGSERCIQEEQQFLPEMVGGFESSLIMQRYVRPILEAPGLNLLSFDPDIPEHRPMIETICSLFALHDSPPPCYELAVQQGISGFWAQLYALIGDTLYAPRTGADDHHIKLMLAYISEHYSERLTLEDIARAAYMSPRACGRCFQTHLGTTPFTYLLDYRVRKACELLSMGSTPVGEIAMQCGFGSSSHFSAQFQRKMNMTPNAYRQQSRA